ncbi:hypothetical protein Tco_0769434 [Tanacetum coccineum]|uniref:Uncharacterized protein n=1 Tax=Tanacetum coccineum TaxID=301880 RepID=A0ABQ4ZD98_9ASTR
MVKPYPVKKLSKKDKMMLDEELAFKLQAKEEERLAREKAQKIKEVNIAWDDVQARVEADYQLAQRLKHFAAKRAEEKRNKPPTRAQQRSIMCTYLKNMEGWKPKNLKNNSFANIQELFDRAMKRVNTFVDYRTELVEESSKKVEAEIAHESSLKRAGEELEQESSKKQKLEEDKESEELKKCLEIILDDGDDVIINATPLSTKSPTIMLKKFDREDLDKEDLEVLWSIVKARFKKTEPNMLFYLLVEKMYPLTNHTLHQMFNDTKLQVNYECEMAFELLRLVKKQLKEGYLMLLVYKLLLLVLEVNAASTKVTTAQRLRLLKEFLLSRDG